MDYIEYILIFLILFFVIFNKLFAFVGLLFILYLLNYHTKWVTILLNKYRRQN
jgi:hypothetical protein